MRFPRGRQGHRIDPVLFAAAAAAAFDPATLSMTGWYRGSYAGSPWTPTASAGTSGTNGNIVTIGAQPTVGTAVNGFAPAVFNGSTQAFQLGTASTTDLVALGGSTVVVLAKATLADADQTNFYSVPGLFTEGNGSLGLAFTDAGVRYGVFSSGTKQTVSIPQATGAWFMAAGRYDGVNVKCRVNSTDATPVAASPPGSFVANSYFGRNYANSAYFNGQILEIMTFNTAVSDATLVNIKSYFNSRYSLSL